MKITICNSAKFHKEVLEMQNKLKEKGHEALTHPMEVEFRGKVVPVEVYYNARKEGWDEEIELLKEKLIREHFDKIKSSDAVFILNLDKDGKKNYIGGNTLIEMGLAFALDKKIFMLNPIPEDLSYTEEIKGMRPIVIDGNLEEVKIKMQKEFETQALDINPEEIKEILRKQRAKETPEVLQKRWVFDIQCSGSKVPGTGEWIRLRQINDKITVTYKNKKGTGISDTEEIEVGVEDFDKTAEMLSKLNCFTGKYYQENKRIKFELKGIEFTLDTWPMIPTFLEIEAESEEKVKQGLKIVDLEGKDAGHIGAIKIYKKYGIDLHAHKELTFKNIVKVK